MFVRFVCCMVKPIYDLGKVGFIKNYYARES